MNILFLAAEAEPFIKIGGLADVAGTLPHELRNLTSQETGGVKLDVRLVLPWHRVFSAENWDLKLIGEVVVKRGDRELPVKIYEANYHGLPVYFIRGDLLDSAEGVYSQDPRPDREKYAFFSLAVLEMMMKIDWRVDILHANDWHTALAIHALGNRRDDPCLDKMGTLITLHNLPYMGGDGADVLEAYGLDASTNELLPWWARTQPLPLGLARADAIVPVSEAYAREILTPEFGSGLETFLGTRKKSLIGILNGLDQVLFDPEHDPSLAVNFSARKLEARKENKRNLQESLGLPLDNGSPLLGMVGRINQQKGVDLALEALERMGEKAWQFVLLGAGDGELEGRGRELQSRFGERVRVVLRYDEALGRKIYGGADIFLMPSRYEPCGLAQMIAMRYGCVPVVRSTGGLQDTVCEGKTGFLFRDANSDGLREAICRAVEMYEHQPGKWQELQRNGMGVDFSWKKSARKYAEVYRKISPWRVA